MRLATRWLALGVALLSCACHGRGGKSSSSGPGSVAIVNLSVGAPEDPVGDGFFPAPAGENFTELVLSLRELTDDKKTRGVFVKLKGQSFSFAQAKEIGDTLALVKEKKPVVCHTHQADNSTFWLLSRGCSDIWVSAAGDVPTVGIGAELSHLRGALDKVGVYPDMLAMGRYKSGGEALTRYEPSPDSLANLQNTLSDLRDEWLAGVSKGHEKSAAARRKHVEDGPWTPQRAKELGLIGHVGFEDEALHAAKKAAQVDETHGYYGMPSDQRAESPAAELVRLLAGARERSRIQKRIAVVPAVGSITVESGGAFGESGITSGAMTRVLKRLREDETVAAIVMRMNSPGGSPLASDLIWREMMLTRKEKPVIVSIGGMSASGGYYIASGATKIVSSPAAIVGSIGVFGGKIVLDGALQKIGVNTFQVPASPEEGAAARSTQASPLNRWDEATRERVRASMQRIYDLFIARVAEGRGMPAEKVAATAQGEIFMAAVGKERGLIDELGGITQAIALARKEAKLKDSVPVVLEGTAESLFEALFLGPEPSAAEVQGALTRFEQARLRHVSKWALGDHVEELRPFAASLSPLLAGESVVVALPYALQIH